MRVVAKTIKIQKKINFADAPGKLHNPKSVLRQRPEWFVCLFVRPLKGSGCKYNLLAAWMLHKSTRAAMPPLDKLSCLRAQMATTCIVLMAMQQWHRSDSLRAQIDPESIPRMLRNRLQWMHSGIELTIELLENHEALSSARKCFRSDIAGAKLRRFAESLNNGLLEKENF